MSSSSRLLSFLIENSSETLVFFNSEGRILNISHKAEQLLGLTGDESGKSGFGDLFSAEHPRDFYWRNLNEGQVVSFTCRPAADAENVLKVTLVELSEDEILAYIHKPENPGSVLFPDDESLFKSLVQSLPDLFWMKDTDGVFLACNRLVEDLFGASERDIIGKTDHDFVDKETADGFRLHDKKVLESGAPAKNEEWVTFKSDGHTALLETTKTPFYDREGNLIGVFGLGHDITESHKAQEKLQDYIFLMKEMGRAAKVGGWEFDVETGEGSWTEEIALIHEMAPEKQTSRDVGLTYYTDESRNHLTNAISTSIETGLPYSLELEMITPSGVHKSVRSIGYPYIKNGKVAKIRGSFQDITEEKAVQQEKQKLEHQLNQARKMESIGRLAGGVAHDFNNMLGVIQGYTEMILEESRSNPTMHEAIVQIKQATERSVNLTGQLLAFSRQQSVQPRVLDVNSSIEKMISMLRLLIGESVSLIWIPGSDAGSIKIDPSQLDQILVNLCANARDAIHAAGKIIIETDLIEIDETFHPEDPSIQSGTYVLICVSDDGAGIEREVLEKMFEPFFTTKEVGAGTGLGLASIYGIVKQNNGIINVYSEKGEGTAFKVYLPLSESSDSAGQVQGELKPSQGNKETILLVEDEAIIRDMTLKMLGNLGYEVLPAATPGDALDIAADESIRIDLLMTDVIMPEMNGRDLAAKLKELRPGQKCLYMSGYTSNIINGQGIREESFCFLQKPFTRAELSVKVKEALEDKNL